MALGAQTQDGGRGARCASPAAAMPVGGQESPACPSKPAAALRRCTGRPGRLGKGTNGWFLLAEPQGTDCAGQQGPRKASGRLGHGRGGATSVRPTSRRGRASAWDRPDRGGRGSRDRRVRWPANSKRLAAPVSCPVHRPTPPPHPPPSPPGPTRVSLSCCCARLARCGRHKVLASIVRACSASGCDRYRDRRIYLL